MVSSAYQMNLSAFSSIWIQYTHTFTHYHTYTNTGRQNHVQTNSMDANSLMTVWKFIIRWVLSPCVCNSNDSLKSKNLSKLKEYGTNIINVCRKNNPWQHSANPNFNLHFAFCNRQLVKLLHSHSSCRHLPRTVSAFSKNGNMPNYVAMWIFFFIITRISFFKISIRCRFFQINYLIGTGELQLD